MNPLLKVVLSLAAIIAILVTTGQILRFVTNQGTSTSPQLNEKNQTQLKQEILQQSIQK